MDDAGTRVATAPTRWVPLISVLAVVMLASSCTPRQGADPVSAHRPPASPSTTADAPLAAGPPNPDSPNARVARSQLSQLPAFADVPWADDMKVEQDRFDATPKPESPYGDYSVPPFSGRYLNVSNSERRTLRLPCPCPHRTLWILGGSSAFGLGQRDDYTVASDLARLGYESGIDLEVHNFAVPGKTAVDELAGLRVRLDRSRVKPDLVVFLDGFNDVIATYMYFVVTGGSLLDPIRFDDRWANQYINMSSPPRMQPRQIEPTARSVARSYLANLAKIRATLEPLGIESASFFQPDGFVSPLQSMGLAKSLNLTMAQLSTGSDVGRLLARTATLVEPDVVNLRTPMASFDQPVFADTTHYNETGARFIAEQIFEVVGPELRG